MEVKYDNCSQKIRTMSLNSSPGLTQYCHLPVQSDLLLYSSIAEMKADVHNSVFHINCQIHSLYNISHLSLKCEIGFPQPHIALVHAQLLVALHNKLHFLSFYSPYITCNSSCPLQVMTALFACGTWRVKPASRSSRLTGRSSRSRSTM